MRILAFFAFLLFATSVARADLFEFTDEGIALDGPPGWTVLTISDIRYLHRDADFGSEEIKRRIHSNDPTHILSVVSKADVGGVSPGLHLFYRPGGIDDTDDHLNRLQDYLSRNAQDYRPISGPGKTRLGAFEAGSLTYQYVVMNGARRVIVEETVWVVSMGRHHLTLSSGTAPGDDTGKRQIRDAVRSLRALN